MQIGNEFANRGHNVALVAMCDKYAVGISKRQSAIGIYRIPASVSAYSRYKIGLEIINDLKPEWISLQYVPYAYSAKGFPLALSLFLRIATHRRQCHVMLHELWVGAYGSLSPKQKIVGLVQKGLLHLMLRSVRPASIQTTIRVYQRCLPKFSVSQLPLFGNIPFYDGGALPSAKARNEDQALVALYFGTFSASTDSWRERICFLQKCAQQKSTFLRLVILGRSGPYSASATQAAVEILGISNVVIVGECSEKELSNWFLKADCGISRANWDLHGKSGSTVAMLEHGLPVLLRDRIPDDERDSAWQKGLFEVSCKYVLPARKEPRSRLSEIATAFETELQRSQEKTLLNSAIDK